MWWRFGGGMGCRFEEKLMEPASRSLAPAPDVKLGVSPASQPRAQESREWKESISSTPSSDVRPSMRTALHGPSLWRFALNQPSSDFCETWSWRNSRPTDFVVGIRGILLSFRRRQIELGATQSSSCRCSCLTSRSGRRCQWRGWIARLAMTV